MNRTSRVRVVRWGSALEPAEAGDELATEEPLEIRIGGDPISVTMRTPGNDLELVAGMLLSESLVEGGEKPVLRQEHPNVVNVALSSISFEQMARIRRGQITSTSCGLCGKGNIESVHQHFAPVHADVSITQDVLLRIQEIFGTAQPAFALTGGTHAAAVFDASGSMLVSREDVGRHNAVDKAIGHAVLRGLIPLSSHILMVSGRASFEIVQKALGARIPVVAAVSAPSSLAVELAAESGQTLIGFLRGNRFNVYSHADRLTA